MREGKPERSFEFFSSVRGDIYGVFVFAGLSVLFGLAPELLPLRLRDLWIEFVKGLACEFVKESFLYLGCESLLDAAVELPVLFLSGKFVEERLKLTEVLYVTNQHSLHNQQQKKVTTAAFLFPI